MRVVHLACLAPPEIGGIGQSAYEAVKALRTQGVDARLAVPKPTQHVSSDVDEAIVRVDAWRSGNAAWIKNLDEYIHDADIVHLHYPFYGTAERVLLQSKKPVVVSFHMDATAPGWKGWVFKTHRRILQSTLLKHARAVCVASRDYAHHSSLASYANTHQVEEIPFGVRNFPESANYDITSKRVLFVGGMDVAHAFKGIPVLLKALAQMKDVVWQADMVGDGNCRVKHQEIARALGIHERVTWYGRLSDEDLQTRYREAACLVLPSTSGAEAYGLVAAEAQSYGVPVIASDLPGVRSVVLQDHTGMLVPPKSVDHLAQALTHMLTLDDERARLSRNAREHAQQYRWETHAQRLMDVYARVLVS